MSVPRLLSLDHATTPALDPLQTVTLAHSLGCDAVGLRLQAHPRYPESPYDAVSDGVLRRNIRTEVAARGMAVVVASGFELRAGVPVSQLQPLLEAAADIGARALSVVVYDTDRSRHLENLRELSERGGRLGLRVLLEFFALSGVESLPYALELAGRIGHPALGLSMDSLHVARTGASVARVSAVPPGLIGHAQLNDGPATLPKERQQEEASGDRLLPGDGEFDLVGFVRALPPQVPIGVEAGSRTAFTRGVSMEQHGRVAVAAMRRVLAQAERCSVAG